MNAVRRLKANEIEVRAGSMNGEATSVQVLLYKTNRAVMDFMDEVYGLGNWNTSFYELSGVLYCRMGVRASAFDERLPNTEWVYREDCGVESKGTGDDDPNNLKGQASDAMKRASTHFGCGRELYKWNGVWVKITDADVYIKKDKKYLKTKFDISEVDYTDDGEPRQLTIVDNYGKVRYEFGKYTKPQNKPVEAILPPSANPHTENAQNVDGKPSTTPQDDFVPAHTDEELKNLAQVESIGQFKVIKDLTTKLLIELKIDGKAYTELMKMLPTKYLTDVLKFPLVSGKVAKIELADHVRNAYVKENTVVVVDNAYLQKYTEFVKSQAQILAND